MTKQATNSTKTLYWIATGLFSLLFIGSAALSFFDPQGSIADYIHLDFPTWINYPLGTAKVLGIVAIVSNRSTILKYFAFAGFLYDLLLATGAHITKMDGKLFLALFGLVLWVFAFILNRKMFPLELNSGFRVSNKLVDNQN